MNWISVKDKLPELNQIVFIYYYPKHPVMEGRIYGISKRHDLLEIPVSSGLLKNFDENGFAMASEVTHWMLPEPPK